MAVYETNSAQADDDGFITASLEHLVPGNRGRLLDARRTPVTVLASEPDRGSFVVQIEAFEDRGARWELGLEQIAGFQFSQDARMASAQAVADLHAARQRFDRELVIAADPAVRQTTVAKIADEQRRAAAAIAARRPPGAVDLDAQVRSRRGSRELMALREGFLAERDLLELDREFARAFVTNPAPVSWSRGTRSSWLSLGSAPTGAGSPGIRTFSTARGRANAARNMSSRAWRSPERWPVP